MDFVRDPFRPYERDVYLTFRSGRRISFWIPFTFSIYALYRVASRARPTAGGECEQSSKRRAKRDGAHAAT